MQSSATEVVKRWGEYLDQVRAGESVTITSHGRPVARLLPPPREATAAEVEAQISSLPHRAAVEGAMAEAVAELELHGLAIDRPYWLRAAAALATGAYSAGGGLNADDAGARRKGFRAAVAAAGRQKWEAYKKQRAAAPDPGAAA